MTAKGAYSTRARVLDVLKTAPKTGLSGQEIAEIVYGSQRAWRRQGHAVIETIRLLRREHGSDRIQTILRPDRTTGRNRAYYRWIPEPA